jgi:hypothetical protein
MSEIVHSENVVVGRKQDKEIEFEVEFDEDQETYSINLRHEGEYTGVSWSYSDHDTMMDALTDVDNYVDNHWRKYLDDKAEAQKTKALHFPLLLGLVGTLVLVYGKHCRQGILHLVGQDVWQIWDEGVGEYTRFASTGVDIDGNKVYLRGKQ